MASAVLRLALLEQALDGSVSAPDASAVPAEDDVFFVGPGLGSGIEAQNRHELDMGITPAGLQQQIGASLQQNT